MIAEGIFELNVPKERIVELTPYLDDITFKVHNVKQQAYIDKPITMEMRAFAWYYCHNNHNRSDAYRRSYRSHYDKKESKLILDETVSTTTTAGCGYRTYQYPHIKEAIQRIQSKLLSDIRDQAGSKIIEQLQIQAFYDPKMFINPDGALAFSDWEEIPPKYRCCVEEIKTDYKGYQAQQRVTHIKLVDRDKARKELMKLAPDLFQDSMKLIHATYDKDGNETGLDFSKMSDDELKRKLTEIQQGE